MAILEDALNGNTVAVSDDRRLFTEAVALDEATRISVELGNYFILCNGGNGHTNATGYVLWMSNNSNTQNCLIQNISISADSSGYWHLGKGGSVASYDSAATPVNFNLNSSNIAPISAFKGTSTGISFSSNPSKVSGGHVTANAKWVEIFGGSLVLGVNNAIGVSWQGTGKVAVGIQFFMKAK